MAALGDLPSSRPGTVSFYLPVQASDWTRLLELFLHPPWTEHNDDLLVAMQPVGGATLVLIEIPARSVEGAIALATYLGHQIHAGIPVVNGTRAPARNARTYLLIPRNEPRFARGDWTDRRIMAALCAAGYATTADWVDRFWSHRPEVTVEIAEQAFRDWLPGPGRLPREFAPPAE